MTDRRWRRRIVVIAMQIIRSHATLAESQTVTVVFRECESAMLCERRLSWTLRPMAAEHCRHAVSKLPVSYEFWVALTRATHQSNETRCDFA